jgi:hypothetical protein
VESSLAVAVARFDWRSLYREKTFSLGDIVCLRCQQQQLSGHEGASMTCHAACEQGKEDENLALLIEAVRALRRSKASLTKFYSVVGGA